MTQPAAPAPLPVAPPVADAKTRLQALKMLAAGRLLARVTTPYFTPMLLTLVPREQDGLGTIGTTKNAILSYDPVVIAAWTAKQVAGALIHEVMHLWLRHFDRVGLRDHTEWNWAGDRAINPGIFDVGLELPGSHCLMPADLGMDNGLTADEYYKEGQKQGGGSGGQHPGQGRCGSCAGGDGAGEPAPDDAEARSDAQVQRAAKETTEAVRAHAEKGQGKLPAAWARIAAAGWQPPKVPWRQELSYLVRAACAFRAGAATHRFDAPGRRQAGLGYGQGVPIMPRLREPVARVSIVVDTSGSMGVAELEKALIECNGIVKSVGGAVDFCVCDAEVHGLKQVTSVAEMVKMLAGGGGTDFRPAFTALEARKPRPDIIVFLTDGMGTAPEQAPKGIHTIWGLMGPYVNENPAPWGKKLRIEMDEDEVTS